MTEPDKQPPLKRAKISNTHEMSPGTNMGQLAAPEVELGGDAKLQAEREAEVGITEFVSSFAMNFSGILKKR